MATNILNARHAAGTHAADKVSSSAYDQELEQDDPILASTGMDLLRLRKLGVQQETKVCKPGCALLANGRDLINVSSDASASSQSWPSPPP